MLRSYVDRAALVLASFLREIDDVSTMFLISGWLK